MDVEEARNDLAPGLLVGSASRRPAGPDITGWCSRELALYLMARQWRPLSSYERPSETDGPSDGACVTSANQRQPISYSRAFRGGGGYSL